METPRLEINISKIYSNTKFIVNLFKIRGIDIMGITKVVLGNPQIAKTMVKAGVKFIGDSRIENIKKMREAGVETRFVLIRTPLLSRAEQVVAYADISFNSELRIIQELSKFSNRQNKIHQIILMVELGDLREGILPEDLEGTVYKVLHIPGIQLIGIGTNLGCYGGVVPEKEKMDELSNIVRSIEERFDLNLDVVSGGNSYNLDWYKENKEIGTINNLRIGELIFLGWNTLTYRPVEGLYNDAFALVSEVIESKIKESLPCGKINHDAFGSMPEFEDRGKMNRVLLAIGRQDVLVSGLITLEDIDILGSSSDHIILDAKTNHFKVGDEVRFRLNYGALLGAMTSPYVEKIICN